MPVILEDMEHSIVYRHKTSNTSNLWPLQKHQFKSITVCLRFVVTLQSIASTHRALVQDLEEENNRSISSVLHAFYCFKAFIVSNTCQLDDVTSHCPSLSSSLSLSHTYDNDISGVTSPERRGWEQLTNRVPSGWGAVCQSDNFIFGHLINSTWHLDLRESGRSSGAVLSWLVTQRTTDHSYDLANSSSPGI